MRDENDGKNDIPNQVHSADGSVPWLLDPANVPGHDQDIYLIDGHAGLDTHQRPVVE